MRQRFTDLAQLVPILERIDDDLAGFRDRALLVFMYAGRLSGALLSELTIERLSFRSDCVHIYHGGTLRTDAEIARNEHPLTDPVLLVREWLARASLNGGPLFRAVYGTAVAERALTRMGIWMVVKRRFEAAGIEPLEMIGSPFTTTFALRQLRAGARDEEVAHYAAQGGRLAAKWLISHRRDQ